MAEQRLRQLEDDQLDYFTQDGHAVYRAQWEEQTGRIASEIGDLGGQGLKILDVGGGNGRFSDRLLQAHSSASAVVLDSSEHLLAQNVPDERKRTVLGSVTDMRSALGGEKFDFVVINCLLHHLVTGSYADTRAIILDTLRNVADVLSDRGRVTIWENIFEGLLVDGMTSRMIFEITSIKAVGPLARRLGANTAGVGVCFLTRTQWQETIESAGLRVLDTGFMPLSVPLYQRLGLLIGELGAAHFWCGKA